MVDLPDAISVAESRGLELVLPGFVPDSRLSLNGRHRTHRYVVAKLRGEARAILGDALLVADVQDNRLEFFDRAVVTFTFVYPVRRRRDPDGLAGLSKPLLDELVQWNILEDDDSEHVELSVRAIVESGVTETRISIREAHSASPLR